VKEEWKRKQEQHMTTQDINQPTLRGYQDEGVAHLVSGQRKLLLDDMGL
jgi:hypothetical protein